MTDDEITLLGERGKRGKEARVRHPSGKGLGLAIARDVIERHGWQLRVARRTEGGLRADICGTVDTA